MSDPFWGHLTGVVTVALMLVFLGIWVWAWRKRHRAAFKRMSELPMEDRPGESSTAIPRNGEDNNKGGQS